MALTKAQKEKYLKKYGNVCPYPSCKSEDLRTIGRPKADGKHASQDIQCLGCGKMWIDIYTLSDIEE